MKRAGLLIGLGVMVLSCGLEEAPPKPELYSPVNGQELDHPTFVWADAADSYQLELSQDSSFATIYHTWNGLVDTTFTPADSLDEGNYYWRVRGMIDVWGEWSEAGNFKVVKKTGIILLLSPPDADTVKFPTLVWKSVKDVNRYHLSIYKGDTVAGEVAVDSFLTDTSFTVTDTLAPATYRWKVEGLNEDGHVISHSKVRRFVTYNLDESFFPAGPGYVWEYLEVYSRWGPWQLPLPNFVDSTYFSVEVTEIRTYEDSVKVYFANYDEDQNLNYSYSYAYRNDSVYYGYDENTGIYHGIGLFPEDGDRIFFRICGPDPIPIHMTSDSTFWYGWPETYEFGWNEWYEVYYKIEVGHTEYNSGVAQRYHTDPTQSYGEDRDRLLIGFYKVG